MGVRGLRRGRELFPSDLGAVAWYQGNSNGRTQEVGRKRPNAFGPYDMLGNVWEWCDAGYADVGAAAGRFSYPARGGAWNSLADACASTSSLPNNRRDGRSNSVGFRVVAQRRG